MWPIVDFSRYTKVYTALYCIYEVGPSENSLCLKLTKDFKPCCGQVQERKKVHWVPATGLSEKENSVSRQKFQVKYSLQRV